MKKKLFVLALLPALLCLLLSGCHGSTQRQSMAIPETFDESKPIAVTFWA